MAVAEPALSVTQEDSRAIVWLTGQWTLAHLSSAPALPAMPEGALVIDGARLEGLDTSGAYRLIRLLHHSGVALENVQTRDMPPKAAQVWTLIADRQKFTEGAEPVKPRGLLYHIGLGAAGAWQHLAGVTTFIGKVVIEWLGLFRRPGAFRLKEFTAQMESVFVYAIPIIFAMIFLLGVVFAYLMGVQAQKFGARLVAAHKPWPRFTVDLAGWRRLAEAQGIPLQFLEHILLELKHARLVGARRGARGGYWLARDPAEITVADVIRAVEGPLANIHEEAPEDLHYAGSAERLRDVWVAVRAAANPLNFDRKLGRISPARR